VHQAEVALLDEVQQRQAGRLVLLRDGHHEPEVGLHERAFRILAATDGAAKLSLAGRGDVGAGSLEGEA
jgi:hypothetical protein